MAATLETAPDGTKTILIPYSDLDCLVCCMIPDVLCYTAVICDEVITGRIRRRHDPGDAEYYWDSCTAGVRVQMTCFPLTGEVEVIVSDGGSGGPLPLKVPAVWCGGFEASWSDGTDDMPVWRCGYDDNRPIQSVVLTDVPTGECEACLDGQGGIEVKTFRVENVPCPTVCSCCNIVPCRRCLTLVLETPDCDWNGIPITLESPDGGCTWEGSVDPATHLPVSYPNCAPITATATCTGGGWVISFTTADLVDCGADETVSQTCDPSLEVVARRACTGA